jgi:hypothetical protein
VFVAWLDYRSGGSFELYAQHLTSGGTPVLGWARGGLKVSSSPTYQAVIASTPDGAGGVILARSVNQAGQQSVEIHRISGGGGVHPNWPFVVPAAGFSVMAAPDGTGGAIVAWQGPLTNLAMAIRVLGDGQLAPGWSAAGTRVSTTGGQSLYDLASDGNHGAFVAFMTGGTTYIQRLDGSGVAVAGWTSDGRVINPSAGDAQSPRLCSDGSGGAFIGWVLNTNTFTDLDVFLSRMTASGSFASGWPADGVPVCDLPGYQYSVAVTPDGQGGVILAWQDQRDYPQTDEDIYIQRMTSTGAAADGWPVSGRALCTAPRSQFSATVVDDGAGGATVCWGDDRIFPTTQIHAGRVSGDGIVPTLVSLVEAVAATDRVTLVWYAPDATLERVDVERRDPGSDWIAIGRPEIANERLFYVDRTVVPGTRYGYRLAIQADGGVEHLGSAEVFVPLHELVLSFVTRGAGRMSLVAHATLPSAEMARLDLFDVRGRSLVSLDFVPASSGALEIAIPGSDRWSAGVYLARLRQGSRQIAARALVLR